MIKSIVSIAVAAVVGILFVLGMWFFLYDNFCIENRADSKIEGLPTFYEKPSLYPSQLSCGNHSFYLIGNKGPDEWKPPLKSYWKEYATKWKAVKAKYGLVVSSKEEKALVIMIH